MRATHLSTTRPRRAAALAGTAGVCLVLAACSSGGASDDDGGAGPTDLSFASLDQGSAWYN